MLNLMKAVFVHLSIIKNDILFKLCIESPILSFQLLTGWKMEQIYSSVEEIWMAKNFKKAFHQHKFHAQINHFYV